MRPFVSAVASYFGHLSCRGRARFGLSEGTNLAGCGFLESLFMNPLVPSMASCSPRRSPHVARTFFLSSAWKRTVHAKCAFCLLAYLLGGSEAAAMKRVDVDFDYVTELAEKRSQRNYKVPKPLPKALADLDYDEYRKISYDHDQELWKGEGLPFVVSFFHLGYIHKDSVAMNEFTETHAQKIRYLPSLFRFGGELKAEKLSKRLGYAGLRVSAALGDEDEYGEVASFLGASYFRAIGEGMHYGTSARGIAIDSGLSEPEEFPRFVEFWLGKPLGKARELVVYALLDGPSLSGAYEFVIQPGEETVMQVRSRLFMREDVRSFGVAPLTSMFWRGENRQAVESDYRPEVHDADGLLLEYSEGLIWRPLDISEKTRLSYFALNGMKGFGLMQRDREFDHYQDLEAEYHRRPSVWVEMKNDWGNGYVKLVELPTKSEFADNVVAFWEPAVLPEKGDVLEFEYDLRWSDEGSSAGDGSRVVSSRRGDDLSYPGTSVFVVEFSGEYSEEAPELESSVAGSEEGYETRVQWNPYAEAWRVTLRVDASFEEAEAVELQCRLLFSNGETSETWAYQWSR